MTEAAYVELFDRGRATSLHLFEHVHGDSRDRGPAMIDLQRTYEQAGLVSRRDELPDYLPVMLEFASTQPPREARAFLGEIAAHPECALRRAGRSAKARTPRSSRRMIELAGGDGGSPWSRSRRSPRWTTAGPSRRCSTAAACRARRGRGQARDQSTSASRSAIVRK